MSIYAFINYRFTERRHLTSLNMHTCITLPVKRVNQSKRTGQTFNIK